MADRSQALIIEALSRGVANPSGLPLRGTKTSPCFFTGTAAAQQAAQFCKDEGYLQIIRSETKGKTVQEICGLTEKGLAYLLSQTSPKKVLEELVRALEAGQRQTGQWMQLLQKSQEDLNAFKTTAEKVLDQIGKGGGGPASSGSLNGSLTLPAAILSHLNQWHATGVSEDCPLPELFGRIGQAVPALTIGHFHDGLRELLRQQRIYLHPWTGPFYDIPEPALALLVGHEVAYYASIRKL